jgi:hypothetical protein
VNSIFKDQTVGVQIKFAPRRKPDIKQLKKHPDIKQLKQQMFAGFCSDVY